MNDHDVSRHDSERDPVVDLLTHTLADEADLVEPSPGGLQRIQARTIAQHSRRNPWVLGTFGAGLAAAAVITTIVVVGDNGSDPSGTTPPAATQPDKSTDGDAPNDSVEPHAGFYDPNAPAEQQVTVYYPGPRPQNAEGPGPSDASPRLYAETHTLPDPPADPELAAVNELLSSTPIDPDYSNAWPSGLQATSISENGGITTIDLMRDGKPSELWDDERSSALALHALGRTAGLSPGDSFGYYVNGNGTDVAYGVASDEEVRPWITIDNIVDGQSVSSPVTVAVSGNVFEGTVNWILRDANGTKIDDGFTTTAMGSWAQVDVELGELPPGTYSFTALEYSAADGEPINADTKTFTVD